jgi:RNA polymerase sigma-70 factor (ECF subfamily)
MSEPPQTSPFAPTRWTLILRTRGETPEARAALAELCEAYYQPVLRFLQCEGRDEDTARELTQDFFARILASSGFDAADPQRGRFRSYLLGALKHFLADHRKREHRLKRGGGLTAESLEGRVTTSPVSPDDESSLQVADTSQPPPDASFDREWALALMARALAVLEREFTAAAKADHFEVLKPWLMGEGPSMSQAEAGQRLSLSEGAVKVMIHRLRRRFREAVRTEISQTLREPAPPLVDEELRHLIAALS